MRFILLMLAVLFSLPSLAQEGYAAYQSGDALMKEGKAAQALPLFERAAKDYPRHTAMWSAVAGAAAAAGEYDRVLEALERLATFGGTADLKNEPLSKLPASPRRAAIEARFRENAASISASRIVAVIPERELLAESIAYDPKDGAYYAGSMFLRKIVRIGADGVTTDFIAPASDGIWSVLGIKIDPEKRELWANACNAGDSSPMKQPDAGTVGRGGVWRYSLDSGKLIRRYLPDRKVCFNDLAFARGRVFMTSGSDGIWSIDPVSHEIAQADPAPELWANGIASDERGTIYVADALTGVMRFEPDTRQWSLLEMPDGVSLGGIDGLYVWRGKLVGIQNALRGVPPRVIVAPLDESRTKVTSLTVLERAHPLHDIPTCGVVVGDRLVYHANSQLRAFTEGKIWPAEKLHPTWLLGLDLPASRDDDRRALLELHEKEVRAHLELNVAALVENQGETFVMASNGGIHRRTKRDIEEMFTNYFRGAKYEEYATLEGPIVQVSDDGGMAWALTRTRVRRSQTTDGKTEERTFVYAGAMMYEKQNGVWKRVANASTFEP
ncbi:MAG: tetratricopeptide repeat protein [Thermoanaerobaculia bacterium]